MAGVILASAAFLAPTAAGAYDSAWTDETSYPSGELFGVSCTDASGTTSCVAVGYSTGNDPKNAVYYGSSTGTGAANITWTGGTLPADVERLDAVDCVDVTTCVAVGVNGVIVKSTNGGASWTQKSSSTIEPLFAVSCSSTSVCVAMGDRVIRRTTNGGGSWSAPTDGSEGGAMRSVDCVPSTTTCLAVGPGNNTMRSVDSGATWAPDQPALDSYDLLGVSCLTATNCFFAGTSNIVHYSSGVWSTAYVGVDTFTSISCTEQSCVAAGYRGYSVASSDGGKTWVQLSGWIDYKTGAKVNPHDLFGASCTTTRCRGVGRVGASGVIQKL